VLGGTVDALTSRDLRLGFRIADQIDFAAANVAQRQGLGTRIAAAAGDTSRCLIDVTGAPNAGRINRSAAEFRMAGASLGTLR
jgi:hypothetical protein